MFSKYYYRCKMLSGTYCLVYQNPECEDTPKNLSYTEHAHCFLYFCVICEDRICVGVHEQTGGE